MTGRSASQTETTGWRVRSQSGWLRSSFCGGRCTVTIPSDFREFVELLNSSEVEYVVVGGYALAFHGAPRFTGRIECIRQ